jgi:hypothetical protein
VVLITEHIMLAFILLIKAAVPDYPRALLKHKERIELSLGQMGVEVVDKTANLKKFSHESQKTPEIQPNTKNVVEEKVPKRDKKPKKTQSYDELQPNLRSRLYRETFLMLERLFMHQKSTSILQANNVLLVKCSQGCKKQATQYCLSCLDHFCGSCFHKIHYQYRSCKSASPALLKLDPTDLIT